MLDRLADTPVIVTDAAWGIVAANPLAAALLGDPLEGNVARRHFSGAPTRVVRSAEDEDRFELELVAGLHTAAARYPDDAEVAALVAELRDASPRFAALWDERPVAEHVASHKTIRHPEVGDVTLDCDILTGRGERPADRRLHGGARLRGCARARAARRGRAAIVHLMRDDITALLGALVAIDSVNPALVPGGAGEAEIAAFVAGWARDAGPRRRAARGDAGTPQRARPRARTRRRAHAPAVRATSTRSATTGWPTRSSRGSTATGCTAAAPTT